VLQRDGKPEIRGAKQAALPIRAGGAILSPMAKASDTRFDVAVVGGGAAGHAAALVAAIGGFRTILFAPSADFPAGRTAALMQGSIDLLSELDAWPTLAHHAAPFGAIRLIDASRRLIRAPEVTFYASEIGLSAFGYNIPNGELVGALSRHARAFSNLTIIAEPVDAIDARDDDVHIRSDGVDVLARLVVAADGARSLARDAADIRTRRWEYSQAALVATLATQLPHQGVSTEFHFETGPFTLVPLAGDRVSLVWVDRPEAAERAMALSADEFSSAVETRAQSIHGAMKLDSQPAIFPLGAALADRFAARRTVLVGEAAHLFPPIGAQGLNLGFRDVAALKQVLSAHRVNPGSAAALRAYHNTRQGDVRSRTLAIDLLNRSLLTDFLPVQIARWLGLSLASSVPFVRHALMRQGLTGGIGRVGG
jgi:2-octaprenyl-6-methoxyphenol hydroxylase